MDVIAFRLHTGHRVAVPCGCALFVRGGAVSCEMRGSQALLDPNHALLVPLHAPPPVIAALGHPASLTLICDRRLDLGGESSLRLIDSRAFVDHFCIALEARDAGALSRFDSLVRTLREPPPAKSRYGRNMQQYVNAALTQPFGLNEVARAAGLSSFAASRIFHRELGLPLRAYVRRLRLRTALACIAERHDLAQVALHLGFFDHAHFTKAFRAEFGMTPSQWRDFVCTKLYKTA